MTRHYVTRRVEFDAAHRVPGHESKCRNLHGHRYGVEITVTAPSLDRLGRVIDFGLVKAIVGGWIDTHLDHGTILHCEDERLRDLVSESGWKLYTLPKIPTAENLAEYLFEKASELLSGYDVDVHTIRVYETPNCWAQYSGRHAADFDQEDGSPLFT